MAMCRVGSAGQWLTVALCLVTATDGLMRALLDHTEHVETVYIRHASSRHRAKRSTNQSSQEIHVTFSAQNQPIRLRLRRHAEDVSLPVYTLSQGHVVKKAIQERPRISFYHDPSHGATFIYTRNHNSSRPFDLDGSMFINGFEYIVTPNHLVTWVGGGGAAHTLRRLNSKLLFGHDGIDTRDPYTRFASQVRTARRRDKRLGRESQQGGQFPQGVRRRRQTSKPEVHYVELSMIADYAVWKRFLRFTAGDEDLAFKELQQYYLFMAVMMDVRYKSVTEVDPTLKIQVVPVSLIVTDVQEEAIWTENYRVGRSFVQSINSLYALREWVRRRTGVPRSDHTMLFSGYDLVGSRSDSSTIGVAFIGTACTYNSVSVIEEYFTGTSGTVSAHELGHSLDAEHDANYRACSDVSANVMSTQAVFPTTPGRVSNPWRFSACSVDAFGAFLETATCAREEPQKSLETSQSGGGYFTADQQCQLAMGQDSYFCRSVQARKGFDRMCRHLYCYLPDDPGYCGSIIASEFTVCGDGKWCHEGACVSASSAPAAVSDTCPQGDEPGYQCSPDDCDVSKVKDIYCCQTCALNNESQDARQKTESSKNAINQTSVFTLATTTRSLTTTKTPTSTVNGPGTAENLTDEFGPSQTPVASTSETTRVTARSSGTFPQSTVTTTREKVTTTSSIPATTTTVFDVSNTDAITLMPNSVSGYPEVEFTTSATIIKNGRHSTVPTTTSTQNEVSSVTTASPGLPETTARMTSTDTTKPSIIDINNTDVVTLSPASPLPTEARDSEWMTTRTTTSAINTTRVDLNTSRPAVTQTLHTPEHFTPQLTTSVAPQITTAGLENETPLQNTKLLRPNTETTHQTATSPATSHIPPIKTSSTIPSSLGDNGKMETDGIPNASTTEALKPSSTSSPTPRTATTKPVKLATTTAASRLSSTDASIKLTSTAKNTPARRPSTTTAPCYSIYCLCVRCYSCYANVCNMFLPGGFYYNQIYGRPF